MDAYKILDRLPPLLERKDGSVYLAEFNKNSFPSSRAHFDHMSYVSSILDDEDLGLDKKLRASYLLGEMGGYKSIRYFTMGMASEFAFQEAMERYKSQH